MEITQQQYEKIADIFPRQRGNVTIDNLTMLNAMLHILEHGCKWRGVPSRFGNWHSIYTRMSRWSKNDVLDLIFTRLQQEQMIRLKADVFSLDSTVIKVHPDGTAALKKNGPQSVGKSCGGWTTKLHLIAAGAECAVIFSLSPSQAGDAPAADGVWGGF